LKESNLTLNLAMNTNRPMAIFLKIFMVISE
jgi:hypothetical protein